MDKTEPLRSANTTDPSTCYNNPDSQSNNDPSTCYFNPDFQSDEVILKPPTSPSFDYTIEERPPLPNLGDISETEVREACMEYTLEHCWYSKKFVRDAVFTDIHNDCIFHYRLETFAEQRQTAHGSAPYTGQLIDGPENGLPPDPWTIDIPIPEMFANRKILEEVPHTAYVKQCHNCVGIGRIRCDSCNGRGGKKCTRCLERGRTHNTHCFICIGTGRRRCSSCTGTGQVNCQVCDGCGMLKHFIQLIITWKNHANDFYFDTESVPLELLSDVSGRELLQEQQLRVCPINHCPNPAVNNASSALILKHETSFPDELIRMQRQTLIAIPLTKAKYLRKRTTGECYVFGFQKKVYFERYPQSCCCCICL